MVALRSCFPTVKHCAKYSSRRLIQIFFRIRPLYFSFWPDRIEQEHPHPISAMYSAATMWTACSVSTISVLDCPQIISLVLPSDSLHLAGADKAPPKWPGGHNFTSKVNGRDRPLCPSKCNFRLSPQCCHFPGSGMLWINLKNMEWEIAQAVVRTDTPLGLYFQHTVKTCMGAECCYRIPLHNE